MLLLVPLVYPRTKGYILYSQMRLTTNNVEGRMATSVSKAWSAAGTLCVPISGYSFSNVVLALRVGAALLQSIAALRNRGGAISQTVFPYVPLRQRLQRKKLHANFTFEYHHCATILLLLF